MEYVKTSIYAQIQIKHMKNKIINIVISGMFIICQGILI